MNSAATLYQYVSGNKVHLYEPLQPGKKPSLIPFIRDIIQQRTNWKQPKQKREPYTYAMFEALSRYLCARRKTDSNVFLSAEWAVFDWSGAGIHTGSRLGEYGQSKPKKGVPFAMVPMTEDAGDWAGTPLAFIQADFTFYDHDMLRRSHSECLADESLAAFLHVHFHYDKSKNNFTIRKYRRVSGSLICIIKRSLAILRRAYLLGIPAHFPIGAYRPLSSTPGQFAFLDGDIVRDVMRFACRLAYPDPRHYMRLHSHLIMSHSNRVTAAVALYNAGVAIPIIAHCLRWSVESVSFYLRDCFRAIGPLTLKAIEGAHLN